MDARGGVRWARTTFARFPDGLGRYHRPRNGFRASETRRTLWGRCPFATGATSIASRAPTVGPVGVGVGLELLERSDGSVEGTVARRGSVDGRERSCVPRSPTGEPEGNRRVSPRRSLASERAACRSLTGARDGMRERIRSYLEPPFRARTGHAPGIGRPLDDDGHRPPGRGLGLRGGPHRGGREPADHPNRALAPRWLDGARPRWGSNPPTPVTPST